MKYFPTIGIECHVQLSTKTKLFSEVDNDARQKEPNSCVSPVDYALPGMLPRLNGEAINFAIRAGHAMHCDINIASRSSTTPLLVPAMSSFRVVAKLELSMPISRVMPVN